MTLDQLVREVISSRDRARPDRACVVGISGIDASGKGYVSGRVAVALEAAGYRVALISVDGWLNLPRVRFLNKIRSSNLPGDDGSQHTPEGTHFYQHALRLEEMFSQLIIPLRDNRSVELSMDFAEETATEFRRHTYAFTKVDIVLLEGIFIFKREFVHLFDLKIWIECGIGTALARAVTRSQEKLAPEATIEAYESTYFPAQHRHFEIDDPRTIVDITYSNE